MVQDLTVELKAAFVFSVVEEGLLVAAVAHAFPEATAAVLEGKIRSGDVDDLRAGALLGALEIAYPGGFGESRELRLVLAGLQMRLLVRAGVRT